MKNKGEREDGKRGIKNIKVPLPRHTAKFSSITK